MSYGHICTHRCSEHWGWNLEKMKVYFAKDADYVGIFAEANIETGEIIITVLSDGDVHGDGENDVDISEEDKNYKMIYLKGKMDEDVIDKYVGWGIYDVSENGEKDKQSAKEKDLCKPIHIAIKDSEARHRGLKWLADILVDVRKDCDIQLESVTGEYT